MRSKAGYIALTGECLTMGAVLWTVQATLLQKDADPSVPGLAVVLALTLFNMFVFLLILRKEISVTVLAACSAVVLALNITAHLLIYQGSHGFGYVMSVILVAGVTVFVPLYYCMNEMPLFRHLVHIDVMVFTLLWLFLVLPVVKISTVSIVCAAVVVLIDIGGAVVMRMSEGGMSEGIGRAFALAVGSAGVAAVVIFLLVKIFSRSQGITGAVLGGIRAFFVKIWELLQGFFEWLAQFARPVESDVSMEAMPQVSIESDDAIMTQAGFDPTILAIAFGAAAVIIVLILVIRFRKSRISFQMKKVGSSAIVRKKTKRKSVGRCKRFADWLMFRKNAFVFRNTPKGVLVWLERRSARKKQPRKAGESIRAFTERISPDGTLTALADALDAQLYGGRPYRLTPQECRDIKKRFIRNTKEGNTDAETA